MADSPKTWIPTLSFGVKVLISLLIICLALKYIPWPEKIKALFRV